jgi:hypothetical protein
LGDVTICSVGGDVDESELRRGAELDVEEAVVLKAGVGDDEELEEMGDAGTLPNDPDFRDPLRDALVRIIGGAIGSWCCGCDDEG